MTFRIFIPATFVPTLAAFYWKRATATRALVSSLCGAAASALWTFLVLPGLNANLQSILEPTFIGVTVSLATLVAGSYLSQPCPPERWQKFIPR